MKFTYLLKHTPFLCILIFGLSGTEYRNVKKRELKDINPVFVLESCQVMLIVTVLPIFVNKSNQTCRL